MTLFSQTLSLAVVTGLENRLDGSKASSQHIQRSMHDCGLPALQPQNRQMWVKRSNTVTCVACHINIFGQGSGRSLAVANPSSKTFLWDFGGGWRLGRWRWLVVGAPGARIRALALFFCGGWRSGRGGARIRAHKLLGESEPRDWRCRSPIRAHGLLLVGAGTGKDIFGGWCIGQ